MNVLFTLKGFNRQISVTVTLTPKKNKLLKLLKCTYLKVIKNIYMYKLFIKYLRIPGERKVYIY